VSKLKGEEGKRPVEGEVNVRKVQRGEKAESKGGGKKTSLGKRGGGAIEKVLSPHKLKKEERSEFGPRRPQEREWGA